MAAQAAAIITAEDVSKHFVMATDTVQAVQQATCSIPKGSFTIVYGPSGSGKSTLFHMLAGLERPTSGVIKYEGTDIYNLTNDQRATFRSQVLGILYQNNYWVQSLPVIENVALPLLVSGYSMSQAKLFAKESLSMVDMLSVADQNPVSLSGGQQQRVAMARALVANPMVIMADEPTGNLDSKNGQLIVDVLVNFQKKFGKTVIMITHNLDYLVKSTHRLYLQDGFVREESGAWQAAEATKKLKSVVAAKKETGEL